jgi:hypothetical protein
MMESVMERDKLVVVLDPTGIPHECESNEVYIDHESGKLYILVGGENPAGDWIEGRVEVKYIDPFDTEGVA